MTNLIAVIILVLIVALASGYIIRAKKRGVKCVGCPDASKCCGGSCDGCKGCNNK